MITWYESIMSYWRRRAYERIGTSEPSDPSKRSRSTRSIRLRRLQLRQRTRGAAAVVRTPFARLRLKALSPLRLLARLRNVYIDMMLGIARADRSGGNMVSSHQVTTTTPQGVWIGRIPSARRSASAKSSRLERRMMLNLYNSLVANPELLHSEPNQLVQ